MGALFFLYIWVGQLAIQFNTCSVLGRGSKRLLVMRVEAVLVHNKFPSLLRWGISRVSLTWFSNCSVNHNYLDGGLLPGPGDSWASGWVCEERDCIFPMPNATQEINMWNVIWPPHVYQGSPIFRDTFARDKSLPQQTCTECLFHSWYGPRQGCRWPGLCGLMGGLLESPDVPSPLWYVCPSKPEKSLMRKGGWCVSLTWAVGTTPMKNGTLNLDDK